MNWEAQAGDAAALFVVTVLVVSPLVTMCCIEATRYRCTVEGSRISHAIDAHLCCLSEYSQQGKKPGVSPKPFSLHARVPCLEILPRSHAHPERNKAQLHGNTFFLCALPFLSISP